MKDVFVFDTVVVRICYTFSGKIFWPKYASFNEAGFLLINDKSSAST
ncbi:hypothetical protein SAMN03097699_1651 [Flavobacteriaceae bacterium MAR_2010_188]|nr:hypothetical protein SAMN03097699_1651 [Flavobacteriaceae bacterium MAR_2010_188]